MLIPVNVCILSQPYHCLNTPSRPVPVTQVHVPLNLEMRGKKLGLDFNDFDRTVSASAALEAEMSHRWAVDAGRSGVVDG